MLKTRLHNPGPNVKVPGPYFEVPGPSSEVPGLSPGWPWPTLSTGDAYDSICSRSKENYGVTALFQRLKQIVNACLEAQQFYSKMS